MQNYNTCKGKIDWLEFLIFDLSWNHTPTERRGTGHTHKEWLLFLNLLCILFRL